MAKHYFKDLTDKKFGKLTALYVSGKKKGYCVWKCECECGNEIDVISGNLINGDTKSCGCLRKEIDKNRLLTHGKAKTRIYKIWAGMKKRCNDPKNNRHTSYFDKNISICKEWETFEGFYADMAEGYADNLSIDRIDNDKGYYKENCRWATLIEQANNKRTNKVFTVDGITGTLSELSRLHNKNYNSVKSRLRYGWDIERALKT